MYEVGLPDIVENVTGTEAVGWHTDGTVPTDIATGVPNVTDIVGISKDEHP